MSTSQVNRIENNSTNPSYQSVYELWHALETLEDEKSETTEELMNSPITWCKPDETVELVSQKMREHDFSQLPVKDENENIGTITETGIMESKDPDQEIRELMEEDMLEIKPSSSMKVVEEILKDEPAVLVTRDGKYVGIVTKANLL